MKVDSRRDSLKGKEFTSGTTAPSTKGSFFMDSATAKAY